MSYKQETIENFVQHLLRPSPLTENKLFNFQMDVEIIEAKRQQRKLNFLITQTELYAHFMSKKLGKGTEEEQLRILNQLDEEANPRLAAIDDYSRLVYWAN